MGIYFLLPGNKMPNTPFFYSMCSTPLFYNRLRFQTVPLWLVFLCSFNPRYHLHSPKLFYAILTTVDWQLWSENHKSWRQEAKKQCYPEEWQQSEGSASSSWFLNFWRRWCCTSEEGEEVVSVVFISSSTSGMSVNLQLLWSRMLNLHSWCITEFPTKVVTK